MQGRHLQPHRPGGSSSSYDPAEQLREEVDQVISTFLGSPFGTHMGRRGGMAGGLMTQIPVDLLETNEAFQAYVEVPGLTPQDLDITVSGNRLTIKGQKQAPQQLQQLYQQWQGGQGGSTSGQAQNTHLIQAERLYGQFQRTFTLPEGVDRDQVKAEYTNGVLTLLIPKSREHQQQQKKIQVTATGGSSGGSRT